MNITGAMKSLSRRVLESQGYYLRHTGALPYGIDMIKDICRLSAANNIPIRTFLDIGANVGQTSRRALDAFPCSMIYAFEPNPDCFSTLARLSPDPRFSPHNLALGERHETAGLFCNGGTRDSLIFADEGAAVKNVQCTTVDLFCNGMTIDVLKTDTEGHDLAVLRGAAKTLQGCKFVCTEFFNYHPSGMGASLWDLTAVLNEYGFRLVATYIGDVMHMTDGVFVYGDAMFFRPR
jgi:FkbM family methyltransferase